MYMYLFHNYFYVYILCVFVCFYLTIIYNVFNENLGISLKIKDNKLKIVYNYIMIHI